MIRRASELTKSSFFQFIFVLFQKLNALSVARQYGANRNPLLASIIMAGVLICPIAAQFALPDTRLMILCNPLTYSRLVELQKKLN